MENNDTRNNAIASFESGGALGYISVVLADRLVQEDGRPFHEIFERAYGTSVGAINATALWPLRETGEPLHNTQSLMHFYLQNTDQIFEERWWSGGGALANINDVQNLEDILHGELEDLMLSDFQDGLSILVMDADTQEVRVLTSEEAFLNPDLDFRMSDLVRASANAPFHFDQRNILSAAGNEHQFTDAGFACPDQSQSVYWHLNDIYGPEGIPYFVHIGTGEETHSFDIESWSGVSQVEDVITLKFATCSNQTERAMERLMGDRFIDVNVPINGLSMASTIGEIHAFVRSNPDLVDLEYIQATVERLGEDPIQEEAPVVADTEREYRNSGVTHLGV